MKNDLAKTISWRGINGKTAFEKLQLKAVVIGKFPHRNSFIAALHSDILSF